jgi:hypothetical protein
MNLFDLLLYTVKKNSIMKLFFFPFMVSLFLLGPTFANQTNIEKDSPESKDSKRKIQLVILFDTSNSMDGLLEQAKSRLWEIVNETSELRHSGEIPILEIAMYDYGNDGIRGNNYVRKQLDFTSDLDMVSKKLFGLRTNGGSEYCGAVIKDALLELDWSNDSRDLKMIYIAGNERFNQGPVNYKEVCKMAMDNDVVVNTIYCGNRDQGIKEFWMDGASCSNGDYFNINSNERVVFIPTPYDDQINKLSMEVNSTYVSYGSLGTERKALQMEQDAEAMDQAPAVASMRAKAKTSSNYNNARWDLVDAFIADSTIIQKIDKKDLPKDLQGKSEEELNKYVELKITERKEIQEQISELSVKRDAFIKEERAKDKSAKEDDFGTAVNKSIKERAVNKGFEGNE